MLRSADKLRHPLLGSMYRAFFVCKCACVQGHVYHSTCVEVRGQCCRNRVPTFYHRGSGNKLRLSDLSACNYSLSDVNAPVTTGRAGFHLLSC